MNEKLQKNLEKHIEARGEINERETEKRIKAIASDLKRNFSGVFGRLKDLCRPTESRYNVALSVVFGHNNDAIVVDKEDTAIECINYLKEKRSGHATFIPLDQVTVPNVPESLRSIDARSRLACDIVQCERNIEKAIKFATGSTLVCDDVDVARNIRFNRKINVKGNFKL